METISGQKGGAVMENKILDDVKVGIGLMPEYTAFDEILTIHINTVFTILTQLGVGPSGGFRLSTGGETWSEYLPDGFENFESVKSYICLKVRLLFDPPASSTHMNAINEAVKELEWRLNFEAESQSK